MAIASTSSMRLQEPACAGFRVKYDRGDWRSTSSGIGFVTDLEPLPDDMIRARAFAAAEAVEPDLMEEGEIDNLLWSLTGRGDRLAVGGD